MSTTTALPSPEDVYGMDRGDARVIRFLRQLAAAGVVVPERVKAAREVHARLWSTLLQVRDDTARYGSAHIPGAAPGMFTLVWNARQVAVVKIRAAASTDCDPDTMTQILDEAQTSIAAARARAEAALDMRAALEAAMATVGDEGAGGLEQIIRDAADDLFEAMDDRLQDLMEEVLELATNLPHPVSAAATIDAAPAAQQAYRTIRNEHLPTNMALRAAQQELAAIAAGGAEFVEPAARTDAARLREIDTIWPGWAGPTHIPVDDGLLSTQQFPVPAPWPDDPVARLVWEARSGAAWIPTAAQLSEAYAAAIASANARAYAAQMQTPVDMSIDRGAAGGGASQPVPAYIT